MEIPIGGASAGVVGARRLTFGASRSDLGGSPLENFAFLENGHAATMLEGNCSDHRLKSATTALIVPRAS